MRRRSPAATPAADADSGSGPELMFYTSGTTARPKGVVHTSLVDEGGRAQGMEGQVALWSWTPEDVYVMSGPAYHASHMGWALCSLFVGATTVITEQFEARGFLAEVSRHRGTRSFMVPAHFIRMLEIPEMERAQIDVSSLTLIVHAAAPCPVAVKFKMMEAFPDAEIHELYGASEGGATKISPDEWRARPGSVGRPWPGVEIRILDEEGKPVATGESGIIYIRPPGRRRFRYRNDDDATNAAWHDDAFTVGDIGHLDVDGYLTITDRVSDMVLWGGVNIAPREIEEVLFDHPAVVDCAVFGVPDPRDGERLKAMVQLRSEVTTEALADYVGSRLARYKVPKEWELVAEIPRDVNGKVRKRRLPRGPPGGGGVGHPMIRIQIDRDKCVGSGNCVFWAPATFDLDDQGLSVVVDPCGDAVDRVRVAVDGCPSNALSMELVDEPEHQDGEPAHEDGGEGGHGDRLVR